MENLSATANLRWKDKSLLFILMILSSCLSNEQDTPVPQTGPAILQLHNFNAQGPNVEEGTAPQIHYFAQQPDGTYSFTMSLDQALFEPNEIPFETDWSKEYVYVNLDDKGVIASTFPKKFAEGGGFERVNFEYPDQYQVVDNRLNYVKWATSNTNEQKVVTLNPESGVSRSIANFPQREYCDFCPPNSVFTPGDGSIVTINPIPGRLDYYFFSKEGSLSIEHKLPIKDDGFYSSEKQYFSHYLTKKGDDYYFLNTAVDTAQFHWYDLLYFSQTSDFYLLNYFPSLKPNYDVQVKFGIQNKQKVYRYVSPSLNTNPSEYIYADFKELPFQAWDVTNGRQLNIAFNDTDNNGLFSSGEALLIADSEYSPTPEDHRLTVDGGIAGHYSHMIEAYWHDIPISILIFEQRSPGGLVKINAQEISTINAEIFTGLSPVSTIHDIKSYQDGFAVLCNTSHYPNANDVVADVILIDNDFKVDQMIEWGEKVEQEKITSNGRAILFSAVAKSTTLQLMTVINGVAIKKDLTDLAQFTIESFQATPTRRGGWAILAWVWQTPNSRDLLFMELDSDLNLVKK